MSHGGGGDSGIKAEPNLTPLLDMVLQLLMFFMMCVNFVNEQVNAHINLPLAQMARPMEKSETNASVLFLNVNAAGALDVPGESSEYKTPGEIRYYMRGEYETAERLAKRRQEREGGSGVVNTTIIIRADQNAKYSDIFQLLQICKEVGFRKLQLRANIKAS